MKLILWKNHLIIDTLWLDLDHIDIAHFYPGMKLKYESSYKLTLVHKKPSREYVGEFEVVAYNTKNGFVEVDAQIIEGSAKYSDGAGDEID